MEITIDFTFLEELATHSPIYISGWLFIHGGWFFVLATIFWGLWQIWVFRIRNQYRATIKYVLLAIDVPKTTEQTPKAVEQVFTHLASTLTKPTLYEKYWLGKVPPCFSFEIISLEGYSQFLIRTPEAHRDLVEAAFWAQYPECEITEVEDYALAAPSKFPDEQYDLWGTEFGLEKPEAYPIKTYPYFEHTLTQAIKDPMADLLEILSKLGQREQAWLQWVITPISQDWKEAGIKIVKKLIGAKAEEVKTFLDYIPTKEPREFLKEASRQISGGELIPTIESLKKEALPSLMQFLSPGERKIVEAIEEKISKIGFKTKFRFIYLAQKEVMQKARGVDGILGAVLQFNTLNLNGFKTLKKIRTKVHYLFAHYRLKKRQMKLLKAYQLRSNTRGGGEGFVLNTEELASLYHFPALEVKAPLVKKIESKRAEPPSTLPLEESAFELKEKVPMRKVAAPEGLPVE